VPDVPEGPRSLERLLRRLIASADEFRDTVPDFASLAVTWDDQAARYPETGSPGTSAADVGPAGLDTLLHRDELGVLDGILSRWSIAPAFGRAGAIEVWVREDRQRQGIGTALVQAAEARWGPVDARAQRFTTAGVAFATSYRAARRGPGVSR
jgi:GNAT superfamily N-acetyltransferase